MMKFALSNSLKPLSKSVSERGSSHFFSSKSRETLRSSLVSNNLYKRIAPLVDPNVSVVPVLDQWIKEGRKVTEDELRRIVKELTSYKRFKHALEVSHWMTDVRYIPLKSADVACRMNLMHRIHGLEEVENYFDTVHQTLKGPICYAALLNCYAHYKCVEKAEVLMQKAREMGYVRTPLFYNIMMNLYFSEREWEKLNNLMNEMEEKGICFDRYTLGIRLSAYAANNNAEGVDKIVEMMNSNPQVTLDFSSYAVAAAGCLKIGRMSKALALLKKMEEMLLTKPKRRKTGFHAPKRRKTGFYVLLSLYAEIGKKDEVYRIWALYKQKEKINNLGYVSMMNSLLKFNDIEAIEEIFEEWESSGLSYDFRVLDILLGCYCRNGKLVKAEALLNKGLLEGANPRMSTWYHMADGYIRDFQISKAVEALKKAISTYYPSNYRPNKETLTTCLEYLESGETVKAEEFVTFIESEGVFRGLDHGRLLQFFKFKN